MKVSQNGFLTSLFRVFTPSLCLHCEGESKNLVCASCLSKIQKLPQHNEDLYAYTRFEGTIKELIHQFKFEKKFGLADVFSTLLYEVVPKEIDCIIPVPLHVQKLRHRLYNQAALLGQSLGKTMSRPCYVDVLLKPTPSISQTELTKTQRQKNIKDTFSVSHEQKIRGQRVLLVDDVYTTGATLNECTRVLKNAGATNVYRAAIAKAP